MIFLNKNIIIAIIKNINAESAYKYIKYLDYDISLEQVYLILPTLKSNINLLYDNDIDSLLKKLPNKVTKSSKDQLIKLFKKYIKKEG